MIFDARKDLTFGASRLFAQREIFQVAFHADRELRITQRAGVLRLDEGLVAVTENGFDFVFASLHRATPGKKNFE
jgi:hypothetical protein